MWVRRRARLGRHYGASSTSSPIAGQACCQLTARAVRAPQHPHTNVQQQAAGGVGVQQQGKLTKVARVTYSSAGGAIGVSRLTGWGTAWVDGVYEHADEGADGKPLKSTLSS